VKRRAPAGTNGNGKVAHDLSHAGNVPGKNVPGKVDEDGDWQTIGRHAKVDGGQLSDVPTLFDPQSEDARPE
jgi:hypothetical protein